MDTWWRFTATALGSILITLFTVWVTASEFVTETECRRMIQTESPYIPDRQIVRQNSEAIRTLTTLTQKLIETGIATQTKLDLMLDHLSKTRSE